MTRGWRCWCAVSTRRAGQTINGAEVLLTGQSLRAFCVQRWRCTPLQIRNPEPCGLLRAMPRGKFEETPGHPGDSQWKPAWLMLGIIGIPEYFLVKILGDPKLEIIFT